MVLQAVEGPVPEVELVVSVLMATDLTPAGIAAAEAALAAGRPHPQQQIVSLIQPVLQPQQGQAPAVVQVPPGGVVLPQGQPQQAFYPPGAQIPPAACALL